MSILVLKSRMDHDEVHVTPSPPHVDIVNEIEAIVVGQNSSQGTCHAVSQRLGLHTLKNEARMVAGKECHKSQRARVSLNKQLGLLWLDLKGGRQPPNRVISHKVG